MLINNTSATEKQINIQEQFITGRYQSLPEVILNKVGRFFQKLHHNQKPVSPWFVGIMVALTILSLSLTISLLRDEFTPLRQQILTLELYAVTVTVVGTFILAAYMSYVRTTLFENIFPAIRADTAVDPLQRWLEQAYNARVHLIYSVGWSIFWTPISVITPWLVEREFIGVGPIVTTLFAGVVAGMVIHTLAVFLTLPVKLSQCEFKLFAPDPRNSEVIQYLSSMLMSGVYMMALFMASTTVLFTLFADMYGTIGAVVMTVGWIPIVVWFALNQYALARIIRRTKWRTLNEIQAKIERLRTRENIPSEGTLDHLNKLMAYHDRVRNTPDSALNFNAGLNFLNSLLLPLMAFLLANLDKLLGLFQ